MNITDGGQALGGAAPTYPKMVCVDKKVGETPLEALGRVRAKLGMPISVPMTYAGRLDPLASGVLVVLIGDECKNKDKYTSLDKEYEFEVLFGVSTDTGDVMGVVENVSDQKDVGMHMVARIGFVKDEILGKLVQEHVLEYPAYSSQPVGGKPLFEWAREGKIDEIEIPIRKMVVKKAEWLGSRVVNATSVLEWVSEQVGLVKGDFRQTEILEEWKDSQLVGDFCVAKIKIECESGTYVRVLVQEIGRWVGAPTLAYSIRRTRVGAYSISDCIL